MFHIVFLMETKLEIIKQLRIKAVTKKTQIAGTDTFIKTMLTKNIELKKKQKQKRDIFLKQFRLSSSKVSIYEHLK